MQERVKKYADKRPCADTLRIQAHTHNGVRDSRTGGGIPAQLLCRLRPGDGGAVFGNEYAPILPARENSPGLPGCE